MHERTMRWPMWRWLLVAGLFGTLAGCLFSGGDGPPPGPPVVSGTVTFDFVPTVASGDTVKLDYANTERRPARFVVVEAIDAANAVLASAVTDAAGQYSLELPANVVVAMRAKAQMPNVAGNPLAVTVLDNTSANALWATTGATFDTGRGGPLTQNLNAGSGWTGSAYDDARRAAAPFAILDVIYVAVQKVVSADAAASFPPLTAYWSPKNIAAGEGDTDEQIALGQIGITHFLGADADKGTGPALYILGKADNDTDEYDRHVIAHEFGHYLQSAFSRDDSIGGSHSEGDVLDLRVAFSEGWGNGWSGIALGDPLYTDTNDAGQAKGDAFDVSAGAASNPGWFSEASVQKFFWDFDRSAAIGFARLWAALKTGLTTSPALTGIHAFSHALATQNPAAAEAIRTILATQNTALPTDAYGAGEPFFGNPPVQDLAPLYLSHPGVGQTLPDVCVNNTMAPAEEGTRQINRAGEFRFIRLGSLPAGTRTLTVNKLSATNAGTTPVFQLYGKNGELAESKDDGTDTQSLALPLDAGDYVLAVSDAQLTQAAAARSCFGVRVD